MSEPKAVTVRSVDYPVESIDLISWPDGSFLEKHITGGTSKDSSSWQASARLALLKKFVPSKLPQTLLNRCPELSNDEIASVQALWDEMSRSPANAKDLHELMASLETNRAVLSNGRPLRWSLMDCNAGCRFALHAHPNIELVYCLAGELHEVRMEGIPLSRHEMVPVNEGESKNADPVKLQVLSLASYQRPWHFGTLSTGQWLVNEVGSVHQSFTATKGNGCKLLVLWGGSHANVPDGQEPLVVPDAVEQMDDRISECKCSEKWDTLVEIFLPESERRSDGENVPTDGT